MAIRSAPLCFKISIVRALAVMSSIVYRGSWLSFPQMFQVMTRSSDGSSARAVMGMLQRYMLQNRKLKPTFRVMIV